MNIRIRVNTGTHIFMHTSVTHAHNKVTLTVELAFSLAAFLTRCIKFVKSFPAFVVFFSSCKQMGNIILTTGRSSLVGGEITGIYYLDVHRKFNPHYWEFLTDGRGNQRDTFRCFRGAEPKITTGISFEVGGEIRGIHLDVPRELNPHYW